MNQKELIETIKNLDPEQIKRYQGPAKFFKTSKKYYENLQDGIASEMNYFENTLVMYTETKKPKGDPDFESDSGSRYWYSKEGIVRGSDHWGNGVANCDWALKRKNGKIIYGVSYKSPKTFKDRLYGFAKWEDYLFKARLIEVNNKEVVTSFKNTIGRDLIKVDGKKYERKVIETFEEYKK